MVALAHKLARIHEIDIHDIANDKSKAYDWSEYVVYQLVTNITGLCFVLQEENAGVLNNDEDDEEVAGQYVVLHLKQCMKAYILPMGPSILYKGGG